jgi:solute:Na+ symporter, SSS family
MTLGILAYLAVIVAIGVLQRHRLTSLEEFALAGRSLSGPMLVGTLFATFIGGATVVGWTGSFYRLGMGWWFSGLGSLLGIAAAAFFLARRFREAEQFTVPDMLGLRYGNPARILGSVLIIFGDIAVIAVQILAMTGTLVAFTDLSRPAAMVLSVVSFTLISLFGGMRGVALTDALQATFILGGLLLGAWYLVDGGGGPGALRANLPDALLDPLGTTTLLEVIGFAVAAFGITAVSQSIIFSKVFAARDPGTAQRALLWLIPAAFVGYFLVSVLGMGARARLGDGIPASDVFAVALSSLIPPVIGGVLIAVVVAAIVTSSNSILLSASVNLSRDLVQPLAGPTRSNAWMMRVGQVAVVVFALGALAVAWIMPDIVSAVVFAYTMYSAGLLVPLYGGYLWRGASAAGGTAGIVAGGGTALGWYLAGSPFGIPAMLPAVVASAILFWVASRLWPD